MNKDAILKNTRSYDDWLIEQLKDHESSQSYLEAVFDAYAADGDITALLLALRSVAYAQGGIGKLAKQTGISREHLYQILSGKHTPRLDSLMSILSSLGFRIRLERAGKVDTATNNP